MAFDVPADLGVHQETVDRGRVIIGFVGDEMQLRRIAQVHFPAETPAQETGSPVQRVGQLCPPLLGIVTQRRNKDVRMLEVRGSGRAASATLRVLPTSRRTSIPG